jgi:hypothetical protein
VDGKGAWAVLASNLFAANKKTAKGGLVDGDPFASSILRPSSRCFFDRLSQPHNLGVLER